MRVCETHATQVRACASVQCRHFDLLALFSDRSTRCVSVKKKNSNNDHHDDNVFKIYIYILEELFQRDLGRARAFGDTRTERYTCEDM